MITDINSKDRLVQQTFADHLRDSLEMGDKMGDVGSKTTSGNPGRWDPGSVPPPALADGGQPRARRSVLTKRLAICKLYI